MVLHSFCHFFPVDTQKKPMRSTAAEMAAEFIQAVKENSEYWETEVWLFYFLLFLEGARVLLSNSG